MTSSSRPTFTGTLWAQMSPIWWDKLKILLPSHQVMPVATEIHWRDFLSLDRISPHICISDLFNYCQFTSILHHTKCLHWLLIFELNNNRWKGSKEKEGTYFKIGSGCISSNYKVGSLSLGLLNLWQHALSLKAEVVVTHQPWSYRCSSKDWSPFSPTDNNCMCSKKSAIL